MVVFPGPDGEDQFPSEKSSSIPGTPDSEQLTVCSIVSLTPDLVMHKDAKIDIHPNGEIEDEAGAGNCI